jgi:multiple sugar transport system permease protein
MKTERGVRGYSSVGRKRKRAAIMTSQISYVSRHLRNISFHIVLIAIAALFMLPLIWSFAMSLRPLNQPLTQRAAWFANELAWSNYLLIFEEVPYARYLLNSAIVAGVGVLLATLTSSWAGFAMAQLGARGQRVWLVLSFIAIMTPLGSLWLMRFLIIKWLGLMDSWWALWLPALLGGEPLLVLLFYRAFRNQSPEIRDAATMDGAGLWANWWHVALPMARPALLAVGLLAFLSLWRDAASPVMYLKSLERYTLAVGLQQLQQLDATRWALVMAGAVVFTLPALLAFGLSQHVLLRGVERSRQTR